MAGAAARSPAPAPARIADLGCATGTLALLLANAGYEVDALDFSPAMIALARTKLADPPTVTITEGDACGADGGADGRPGGRRRSGARADAPRRPGVVGGPTSDERYLVTAVSAP